MLDSDPIITHTPPDDFASIMVSSLGGLHFRLYIFLFLIFILVSTDAFITRVLGSFKGAVDYKQPTSWGTALQGLFLVLLYMAVDIAQMNGVI